MNEYAISQAVRRAREDAGITIDELAGMTGVASTMLRKLEKDCASVSIRILSVVLGALEVQLAFHKPLDPDDTDFLGTLNVREYSTPEDYSSAREWAELAYRMAIADAAMNADLRGAY